MHAQQIFAGERSNEVVAHFYNKLCVVDLETGKEERLPWLREDTGLRVALSRNGKFLGVGSWREGIALYELQTRKIIWSKAFRHIGEIAFLNGGDWVSATCSDRLGLFLFALESGEQVAWENNYSTVVENRDLQLLLAFHSGAKRIDCLDYNFLKQWSFDWNAFSVVGSNFRGNHGILSSNDGKLGLVDFSKRHVSVVDVKAWCSNIAPICFAPSGDGFIALAAEYDGTENSALVSLNADGTLKRVVESFRPERGAAFLCEGRKLITSEGVILDTETGAAIQSAGW